MIVSNLLLTVFVDSEGLEARGSYNADVQNWTLGESLDPSTR